MIREYEAFPWMPRDDLELYEPLLGFIFVFRTTRAIYACRIREASMEFVVVVVVVVAREAGTKFNLKLATTRPDTIRLALRSETLSP
jgi:hypothetical protein